MNNNIVDDLAYSSLLISEQPTTWSVILCMFKKANAVLVMEEWIVTVSKASRYQQGLVLALF